MTLDAGGTNLKFSAIRANQKVGEAITLPSEAHDLDRCLANIVKGFETVKASLPAAPVAISFAFPGPADYRAGVIANVGNLPAFRGGVPLGPILEEKFGIPVFINNDGDLFVYGEAICGFLPYVNDLLEKAGSPKRYQTLFGITLGTGFGGGIVVNGTLLAGDNSAGGEAWLLRNKLDPEMNAEEGASIRAIRKVYAEKTGIAFDAAPDPEAIFEIGMGRAAGSQEAAREAYRQMAEVAGDAVAQALTLVDGLCVVGGGISAAHPLFMPFLVSAVNSEFPRHGNPMRRLVAKAFDIAEPGQQAAFLRGQTAEVSVPGSGRKVKWDPQQRTAIGVSRLGTSQAVSIGAYAYALRNL
jgi:glucokinase